MARRCFFSFHYAPDNWRASTVRNIGAIESNRPATDNDWETVKGGGEAAIKRWITAQMNGRSCTVVLVGENTAGRKWINHEIAKSWNEGMGVVGIYIHGLKNRDSQISSKGTDPFVAINHGPSGNTLSSIVQCYNPPGTNSLERYAWIQRNLANAVEEAVEIRKSN